MLTLMGEERGSVCHLAAGSAKDFHTGANEKQQLIYLLIYKCMCAYGGERVGLCNMLVSTPGASRGKTRQSPQDSGAG